MTTNPVDAEAAPLREHGGVLGWYRDLPKKNQRTFWACFCGWALDSMDANLYGFVIPSLIALWGISPAQAGSLATISLLASSVGGWLGGIMADRFGRVRTLQITVLWFAVFTLLSGLTSSYSQLFVVRALFGLGFGGEWAAGAILIAEMVKDKHRATAGGTVHSAWAVGSMAASLLYGLYFSIFPQALAWRVLFITGVVPAIFVIFIRRFITEPPIYLENKRRLAAGEESGNVLRIFSPPFLWATFRGCLHDAADKATTEKVSADTIETYLRSACTVQMGALKEAIVAFRMKNGMSKKAAGDDAEMTIDDYVSTPADNYKFTASQNAPKAEPAKAAPTMASQPSPQPHN